MQAGILGCITNPNIKLFCKRHNSFTQKKGPLQTKSFFVLHWDYNFSIFGCRMTLRKTHISGLAHKLFLVVEPLRFYPPYTNFWAKTAGFYKKKVVYCLVFRGVYPPYTLGGPTTKKTLFLCVSSLSGDGLEKIKHTHKLPIDHFRLQKSCISIIVCT